MASRFALSNISRKARLSVLAWRLRLARRTLAAPERRASRVSFVVFSKDRPLQLEGLLRSLRHHVRGAAEVHVLYAGSEEPYRKAYGELERGFADVPGMRFHLQGPSFRDSLVAILDAVPSGRIFFLVDDILFKGAFDLGDLAHVDSLDQIFSLRHGEHLDHSYVVGRSQRLPALRPAGRVGGREALAWRWEEAELDWAYPLSVDGHLFTVAETRFWARRLPYRSPNTFEGNLQALRAVYLPLEGVCCRESVLFNNPCNKVQSEVTNRHGELHQSELLAKWNAGYRIDFLAFKGFVNGSVHQEVPLTLVRKDTDA